LNGWGDSPNTEFGSFGGCWSFAGTRSATSGAEVHTHNEDLVAVESLPTILGYGVMLAVSYVGKDNQPEVRNGRAEAQCINALVTCCAGCVRCNDFSLEACCCTSPDLRHHQRLLK
jgi:hypothetical protein